MKLRRKLVASTSTAAAAAAADVQIETKEQQQLEEEAAEEQQMIQATANGKKSIAYLSHIDALRKVLQQIASTNFLPNWTEEDLSGVLIQLSKCGCDEKGAQQIVRFFRDTTVEEILECFNNGKELNKRANQERSRLQGFISQFDPNSAASSSSTHQTQKWAPSVLATEAKRSRGISDESTSAIATFLLDCAANSDKFSEIDSPDYKLIYNHLASMVGGYALRGLRGIDASLILDIFEDLERETGYEPRLIHFFKQLLMDVQKFSKEEFKLGEEITEDNAQALLNIYEFPDDLFDLSHIYRDDTAK